MTVLLIPAVVLATTVAGYAQVVRESVPELEKIDVVERLGEFIPLDLEFLDPSGRSVRLGDYFVDGRPVMLTLGYYECPMLCNLVFNGVSDGIMSLKWRAGIDYQAITVSINPTERPELAAAKQENYRTAAGLSSGGWDFLVGDASQSAALAEAVGFKYYWDEERKQYAHPAVVMLLSPDGKISRYLYGVKFKANDLSLGLVEASQGKIGSTLDRIILYCYHYDPNAGGYVVLAGSVMRLGGLITLISMAALLIGLGFKERRRRRRATNLASGKQILGS